MNEADNPYAVLSIERTADERAVRKAYARKIREFPPETHADEFKRIRAAYELLSDKDKRARFDEASKDLAEYPEEVGRRLRDVDDCARSDKLDLAREILSELVVKYPELSVVRWRQAVVQMQAQQFEPALATVDALLLREPENGLYHRLRGQALWRLEKKKKAEKAFREAFRCTPTAPMRVTLAQCLQLVDKIDEAVELLEKGVAEAAEDSQEKLELCIAAYEVERLGGRPEAEQTVRTLRAAVAKDAELARYVASRLGAPAARLFADKRFDEANATMADCEFICPDNPAYVRQPTVAEIAYDSLPEASRRWLSSCKPGPTSATIAKSAFVLPFIGAVLGSLLVLAGYYSHLRTSDPTLASYELAIGALLTVGFVALALVRMSSPLRPMTTLHSPYLVETTFDKVRAYSLLLLVDLSALHHHRNGAYTHTAITLHFYGGVMVSLTMRNRSYAEGWLQFFNEQRRRALEVLAEGFFEADPGVELLPPRLLTRPPRPPRRNVRAFVSDLRARAQRSEWLAVAVSLGLLPLGFLTLHLGTSSASVWMVSGLDIPVEVVVADRTVHLDPSAPEAITVPVGPQTFVVRTMDGRTLRTTQVIVPALKDAVVFNVLGSALVYRAEVVYGNSRNVGNDSDHTLYAGTEFVVVDDADYVFREPPTQITSNNGKYLFHQVDVAKDGWPAAVSALMRENKLAEARTLTLAVLDAEPDRRMAVSFLNGLVEMAHEDPLVVFAPLRDKHPESVPLQMEVGFALIRADRSAELRTEATTTGALVLDALASPASSARPLLVRALQQSPKDVGARALLGRIEAFAEHYDLCTSNLVELPKEESDLRERALCMFSAGDKDGARAMLEANANDKFEFVSEEIAELSVAMGRGVVPAANDFNDVLASNHNDERRLLVGRFCAEHGISASNGCSAWLGDAPADELTKLYLAIGTGPRQAFDAYEALKTPGLVPTPVALLLLAESVRRGDRVRAQRIYASSVGVIVPFAAIEAFVQTGAREDELWPLRIEALGALDFVRGRALQSQKKSSNATFVRAYRRDPFRTWVNLASNSWPPP